MTVEEFLTVRDPRAGHYELRHGRMVALEARKRLHVEIQQASLELLLPLVRGLGFLSLEFPFRPLPDHEAWQADVAFVRKERWERDLADYFLGAPDLVIEVLSASNTMDDLLDRQEMCLTNGCRAFWTVDPKRQLVLVTTPDRRTVTFDRLNSVPLPEPLVGSIPVLEIFKR